VTTVAATTPYAWPYDGAFDPARTALLVVDAAGTPTAPPAAAALADALRPAGGIVVHVTTTPPARVAPTAPPAPASLMPADHRVVAAGIDGFYGSPLDTLLRSRRRDQLLLAGAWLETAVHSTMRSANDRGYECLLVLDACVAHDPALVAACRSQIEMSGGIFGAVGGSPDVLAALRSTVPERTSP
jgi:biuret amidohydrolase